MFTSISSSTTSNKFFNSPSPENEKTVLGDLVTLSNKDKCSYLTINYNSSSLCRPLRSSQGLGKTDLASIKTSELNLKIVKEYLGESVFFVSSNPSKSSIYLLSTISKSIESIKLNNPRFWVSQGNKIEANEYIEFSGTIYNKRQCYLKSLSFLEKLGSAWNGLGGTLNETETTEVDGFLFNKIDCFTLALNKHDDSRIWFNLGCALFGTQTTAIVHKKLYSASECYLKALSLDTGWYRAWHGLGYSLSFIPNNQIMVDEKVLNEKECYVRALELEPNNLPSWYSLGVALDESEHTLISNKTYSKHQCFLEALHLDTQDGRSWCGVGRTLPREDNYVLVNEVRFTKIQCQLQAIALDKSAPLPWFFLGEILNNKDTIDLNGETLSSKKCYIKALELCPYFSSAWNNIGATLLPNEKVEINGESFREYDCYTAALHWDKNNDNAKNNIRFSSYI